MSRHWRYAPALTSAARATSQVLDSWAELPAMAPIEASLIAHKPSSWPLAMALALMLAQSVAVLVMPWLAGRFSAAMVAGGA